MSGALGTLDFPRLDITPTDSNPLADYADQVARLRSFTDDHFVSGGAPQGPVVAPPTLAQGVSADAGLVSDYIAAQRADAAKRGLWNDQTGLPTGAGVVDAGRQYAQGVLMSTTAPGARAVPGQLSLFDRPPEAEVIPENAAAPPAPNALTAYHGTPHQFAPTQDNPLGAFDLAKMGTGEGAQAYGHGIYLAENENIARSYRDALSGKGEATFNFGEGGPGEVSQSTALDATRDVLRDHPDLEDVGDKTINNASEFVTDMLGDGYSHDEVHDHIQEAGNDGEDDDWLLAAEHALDFNRGAEVTPAGPTVGGKRYDRSQPEHVAAEALNRLGDPEAAADELEAEAASNRQQSASLRGNQRSSPISVYDQRADAYQASADMLRSDPDSIPTYKAPGHLYQAEVQGSPDEFLHWDHPFSEQSPQVQEALGKLLPPSRYEEAPAGRDIYQNLVSKMGNPVDPSDPTFNWGGFGTYPGPAAASQALADAGIKGIRYVDAASRGKVVTPQQIADAADNVEYYKAQLSPNARFPLSDLERAQMTGGLQMAQQHHADLLARKDQPGTHNFVVFNPQTIRIIRRYGIAGLMGGGAAALGEGGSAQQ